MMKNFVTKLIPNDDIQSKILSIALVLATVLFIITNVQTLPFLYKENIDLIVPTFAIRLLREFFIFAALFYVYAKTATLKAHVINLIFIVLLCISTIGEDPHFLVWGLKLLLPLIFFLSPTKEFSALKLPLKQASIFFELVLGLHVVLQVIHLFCGRGYYSMYSFGLNARNPGIMLYPAASSFLTLVLFGIIFVLTGKIKNRLLILTSLSILLCSSITGLVTYLIVILFLYMYFNFKQKITLSAYFVFSFFSLHFARYVPRYIGTDNSYLKETAGGRLHLLLQAWANFVNGTFTSFSNHVFGQSTNAAAQFNSGSVVDSLYTAVLANFNSLWVIIFFALIVYYAYLQRTLFLQKKFQLTIVIFALCSVGLIVTEVSYPFLILFIAKILSAKEESI